MRADSWCHLKHCGLFHCAFVDQCVSDAALLFPSGINNPFTLSLIVNCSGFENTVALLNDQNPPKFQNCVDEKLPVIIKDATKAVVVFTLLPCCGHSRVRVVLLFKSPLRSGGRLGADKKRLVTPRRGIGMPQGLGKKNLCAWAALILFFLLSSVNKGAHLMEDVRPLQNVGAGLLWLDSCQPLRAFRA